MRPTFLSPARCALVHCASVHCTLVWAFLCALLWSAGVRADCGGIPFTETRVQVEPGLDLFARTGGTSGPAILVPGDFLLFDELCGLARSHRVVFYDMRNRGRSSRVEEGSKLTLEADVADLEKIRRHFGLESSGLVGYSYLGKMVVRYALEHPEAVERIVQIGPVPMDPDRTFPPHLAGSRLDDPRSLELLRTIRTSRREGLLERDPEAYCRLEWRYTRRGLVGDPERGEEIPDRCHLSNEWPSRLVFHMRHHFLQSMRQTVITPVDLVALNAAVLTIHGTADRNAPYGGGREWAASLPEARLLTMEGMAHAVHRETDLMPTLRAFFEGRWPGDAEHLEAATDGQRSQLQARDLLRAALEQHASGGRPESGWLELVWRGHVRPRSQSRTPEAPFEPPFPVLWRAHLDGNREQLVLDEELQWPEFLSRHRSVVTPDDSFDVDLGSGAVSPPFREPRGLLARMVRRVPALLLDEVVDREAATLRFIGVVEDPDGAPLHVVSAAHRGERLDLLLHPQGRLVGTRRLVDEPMLGDVLETVRFEGQLERGGLLLPRRTVRVLEGVGTTSDTELVEVHRRPPDPEVWERPAEEPRPETAKPEGGTATLDELAPGVFLLTPPAARDYRSLVVERTDHLVLGEAPVGPEVARSILDLLERRFPEKPVRWVVATHHHFDHSGGIPAILATGAQLATTPGNLGFFRHAVRNPHTVAGASTPTDAPQMHAVTDRWRIPGGPPEITLLRVEPNVHAEEMLVLHLPAAGILFQGDLVRFPLHEDEPLREQARALGRLLESGDLEVERIVGVHGTVGTAADLRRRLEQE